MPVGKLAHYWHPVRRLVAHGMSDPFFTVHENPYPLIAPAVRHLINWLAISKYRIMMGMVASDMALKIFVQFVWYCANNKVTPRGIVRLLSCRIRMRGNQKSFQIGIRLKIATVAKAGRTRGRMTFQ